MTDALVNPGLKIHLYIIYMSFIIIYIHSSIYQILKHQSPAQHTGTPLSISLTGTAVFYTYLTKHVASESPCVIIGIFRAFAGLPATSGWRTQLNGVPGNPPGFPWLSMLSPVFYPFGTGTLNGEKWVTNESRAEGG